MPNTRVDKYNIGGMFVPPMRHTQPNCKVHFTKITFFAFFLIKIGIYKKIVVLLHR